MSFATFNIQKVKTVSELYARCHHNYRETTPKNVDGERTKLNKYNRLKNPAGKMIERFNEAQDIRAAAGARKMRSTTVRAVELVLGASPEFFKGKSKKDIDEWAKTQIKWAKEYYKGKGLIAGSALHLDETTPHLHIMIEPKTMKVDKTTGKKLPVWDAFRLVGNKVEMNKARSSHAEANAKYELKRGKNYYELGETPPKYDKDIKQLRREQKQLEQELEGTSLDDLMSWANEVARLIPDEVEAKEFLSVLEDAQQKNDKMQIVKETNKVSQSLKPKPPWMSGPGR